MATDTRIRIRRNPYHGFEVWLWGNGELTRRSFDNSHDLTTTLADECVSDQGIEHACDMFERLEWAEPAYPLGVSYVGESVSDSPVGAPTDCNCDACTKGHNALLIAELQSDGRSLRRQMFWSLVVIALVAWFV